MERRVWPQTAFFVIAGFVVAAWSVFIAGIGTASFFGDTPSRERYIEAAMVSLTALLVVVLLGVVGRLMGSGAGLWSLVVPAAALLATGLTTLSSRGDGADAEPGRAPRVSDVFGEATVLNWLVIAALVVTVAGLTWSRRRGRSAS